MTRFLLFITALCAVLSFFTLQAQSPDPTSPPDLQDIETERYRLMLPAPVETSVHEEVSTPWGKATLTRHQSRIGHDVFYIFREYAFPADRTLAADRLKQVRSFFLRQRKCSAKDVKPPPLWRDTNGHPFPQTLFEGVCVSPDNFLILTALKPPYVYQLHFSHNRITSTTLREGLEWLISNVRFSENPPSPPP